MTPPLNKDLWLAAALTGAVLPAAIAQTTPAAPNPRSGVATSVTQRPNAAPLTSTTYIENARGQKFTTGPSQTLHILFSDQSAVTVGPNSTLTVAEYRYDAQSRDGTVVLELGRGLLRVVGGFLSKRSDTVVRTPTAIAGVRGGITMVSTDGQNTQAAFLFGQHLSVTGSSGQSQTITRPGYGTQVNNGIPTPPRPWATNQLTGMLQQFQGPVPGAGPRPPAAPTPPAPLLSTPPGQQGLPGNFAVDRLRTQSQAIQNTSPSSTLQGILGSGQSPNQS
jgi:hypothetical protein